MFQNGQTELAKPILRLCQVTRRRTLVRQEAKFVRSKKALNLEKSNKLRFFNHLNAILRL